MNKCLQCRERLQFVNLPKAAKWVCPQCGKEYQKGYFSVAREVQSLDNKKPVKIKRIKKNIDPHLRERFFWWEYLAAFLGIPIDVEVKHKKQSSALVCALLAISVMFVSLIGFRNPSLIKTWGLVPDYFLHNGGITIFTQFFFHADLWHLLGNVYFLLVFGENVEHEIGHKRFAILVLMATVFGNVLHLVVDQTKNMPLVGASGGVAGVMLFYAFHFPKKQLGIIFLFQWVRVPAQLYVALWLIYQLMGALDQMQNASPISYVAHLGGGVIGYAFWRAWKMPQLKNLKVY